MEWRFETDTLWPTQAMLTELYGKAKAIISEHISNVFEEDELDQGAVVRLFRTTASDGKTYQVQHNCLPLVIAVSYRVRSARGTQFRRWATQTLEEYLIKGFVMDDERLKNPPVGHSAVPDDSIGALAQAQISGETDMLAGSPNFGIFSENNVFSLPVETSRYVLFGLASRLDDLEPSTEGSLKVSTPAERPTEADEYMKRQIEVPISTASKGLFALLPQDIDAVLFSEELAQGSTYRTDLDHLVLPISELVAHIHRALSEQSQIYPTVVACAEPDSTDDIASRRIQSASFFHPGS